MENPQCQYEGNSAQLYLSLFIIVGTIASYLPQHVQIVILNSSEGINHFFLLLGTVSAYCNVINIIILQWDLVLCCARISLTTCLESLLGMFQIIMQWFMFFIIFLLYFVYYPSEKKYEPLSSQASLISTQQRPTMNWKHSIIVFYTVFIHLFFTTLIALILLSKESLREYSVKFGNLQGIISMLLASIQYIPQILETVRRGEMGALSIPMMLIQCPGALLFIYSIQIRPGTNWTSWITYAVAGMSQFILICLGVWFFIRDKYFRRGILNPIVQGHSHNILVKNQKSYTNPNPESPQFENTDDSPSTSRSNPPSYDENTPILSG